MSGEPARVCIGSYEIGTTDLVVPLSVLREAERVLDAERSRRRLAAEKAQAERAEAERKTWRGRLRAMWKRWKP